MKYYGVCEIFFTNENKLGALPNTLFIGKTHEQLIDFLDRYIFNTIQSAEVLDKREGTHTETKIRFPCFKPKCQEYPEIVIFYHFMKETGISCTTCLYITRRTIEDFHLPITI